MNDPRQRVVCSGFGILTPFGEGSEPVRNNVFEGKHGFSDIDFFDTSRSVAKRGAQNRTQRRNYRSYIHSTTLAAMKMAGLDYFQDRQLLKQAAIGVGNLGDGNAFESYYGQFFAPKNSENFEPVPQQTAQTQFMLDADREYISIHDSNPFEHANTVAQLIGSERDPLAFINACVSSANAIGYGYDQIRKGRSSCAFVGGVNVLYPLVFYYFDSSRAMAEEVVRPFSRDRSGLLIGDGASMLVLESLESCLNRGATPLVEVLGWGISSDGYHVSQPTPDGRGLACAMEMALRKANLKPQDIDYINAHGTGTPLNDISETRAIKRVFKDSAKNTPISSTKSTTGHMLEATGGVEAVFCIMALQEQIIPPTANYIGPEEELDLDYVTDGPRPASLDIVMSNSSAFGGNNTSLIFKRYTS